ncbi:hypothetical protein ACFE04_008258 [Oxalis oulophora]
MESSTVLRSLHCIVSNARSMLDRPGMVYVNKLYGQGLVVGGKLNYSSRKNGALLSCFKCLLVKKAAQLIYLHLALKKRKFVEEIHEKQEHVKEWLQNLGIGEHSALVQGDDDEPDDVTTPVHVDESAKNRDVPSSAVLPIIRPALGRQHSISDRAKGAMQGYLNHFLGNMDIVNSREVCKFLEVSNLSFSPEYGPKLKEDYVMLKHLPKIAKKEDSKKCCPCYCFGCCNDNWQNLTHIDSPAMAVLCMACSQGMDAFSQSGLYSNHQDIAPICSMMYMSRLFVVANGINSFYERISGSLIGLFGAIFIFILLILLSGLALSRR